MKKRDYGHIMAEMSDEWRRHAPKSAALNERAERVMVDGGSHAIRLMEPFPPRIVAAQGAYVEDEDAHHILDFWQGHFANILGHNPPEITSALSQALAGGRGLQTGFTDRIQVEAAEILCRQTGAERVRFTTSGSLATMNAIMLARAYTGRERVLKIGGGWHGGQPWGLVGAGFHKDGGFGANGGAGRADSAGVPSEVAGRVVVTCFNDAERLEDRFRQHGDALACFIVEPYLGAGGGIPATREFLETARRLTERYGAVLIFDEIISGFRFRAGDLGALYGVRPDLAAFGKIMGGGMPATAVAGRADIMALVGRRISSHPGPKSPNGGEGPGERSGVKFSGGTYSGHPAVMLAAKIMMEYLAQHEAAIYPRLAALGAATRQAAEQAFAAEGIHARCTGASADLPGSSMASVHFPYDERCPLTCSEQTLNPEVCDVALTNDVLKLAMLLEGVYVEHGLGALGSAHTEANIAKLAEAYRRAARRIKAEM